MNWFGGCCEAVQGTSFSWAPLNPVVEQVVTFTGTATGTAPITYTWKLAVGSWHAGEVVTHTYELPGEYQVALTATNACGEQVVTHTLTVLPEPLPCEPVHNVIFDWTPPLPQAGQVVTFTASATGTAPITYSWELEVGSWKSGQVVTYSYALPGDYAIILTATNCVSATAQASAVVTVLPEPVAYYVYLPLVLR